MIINRRETPEGLLVSVCDEDVLGETFEEGEVSLTVEEDFYDGEEVDPDEAMASLSRARVGNVVGTEAVETAIEHGIIDEGSVLEIGETRHAQLLRM